MSAAEAELARVMIEAVPTPNGSARATRADEVPPLTFTDVSRRFGSLTAVDGVTFALLRGEILTLLGPSGCGKTTTLRMAIGLERASSGKIVYGRRVVDCRDERIFVPPERRDMGMVFQSYAIWPHLNVFENVAFPLRSKRARNADVERAVAETLSLVGLPDMAKRASTALSGGQQQRVAVARGLVGRPDVLLMDEPFSNLDAKLRDQVRAELKALQRRLGISTLFVTHDQSEALALSDRIAVMRDGRIEQIGDPVEIYTATGDGIRQGFCRSVDPDGGESRRSEERPARQSAAGQWPASCDSRSQSHERRCR